MKYIVKKYLRLHECVEFMETLSSEQAQKAKIVLDHYSSYSARAFYNIIYPEDSK